MPIYEFYCPDCHTVFTFFSRRIDTTSRPPCPSGKAHELQREVSPFAAPTGAPEAGEGGELPIDEARMEHAMEALAGEAEGLREDDPREAARLMRKFSQMTGLEFAGGVEEAVARMESGEDPEAIEQDLGDRLKEADPFVLPGQAGAETAGAKPRARRHDPTLYDM
ncbi:MAG: zinc ribbon domain-containing protein [Lentisphaerae bacterium]|nr:zinc ribbon domain-containing protein [Lentisphaerota bacterium]